MVKKTLEQRFWLTPDGALGGFDGEPVADGGWPLRVLYGGAIPGPRPVVGDGLVDTDSVMFDLRGCSLQQAAEHGERISKFFDEVMLKAPQSLAFEKVRIFFP
jgi:hypothetical protein